MAPGMQGMEKVIFHGYSLLQRWN